MNYERYEEWVRISFRWIRDSDRDQELPHHIQMLGIEDAELCDIGKQDIFDNEGRPLVDKFGICILEKWQIRAHLWVLGAYELVRMISERVHKDCSLTMEEAIEKIQETKRQFERVRIPLAKREPSRRNALTDFPVAYAGIGSEGLAWKIADDVVISQRQLSDALWEMFAYVRPRAQSSPLKSTR